MQKQKHTINTKLPHIPPIWSLMRIKGKPIYKLATIPLISKKQLLLEKIRV
jgi:hypothetical protein